MIQATPKDYWISPNALYIERNAMGNPDYIQASCISGAQILVYINGVISYDAGHNYRRWTLQASPTVFNNHKEKYVYVAIPRNDNGSKPAVVVFPSEEIDVYGKNVKEEQIGSTEYYYIFLQGILTSSGDNGTENREWIQKIACGYLSSDEAISVDLNESEWYKYSQVYQTTTFLKDLTMERGTVFLDIFAKCLNIKSGGKLSFDGQGDLVGITDESTIFTDTSHIVNPLYVENNSLSKKHADTTQGIITFLKGLVLGEGTYSITGDGEARLKEINTTGDSQLGGNGTHADFGKYVPDTTGARLGVDEKGVSKMEVDYLSVRRAAEFREITIRELKHIGGELAITPAAMQVSRVEKVANGFKCYFDTEDVDGKKKVYQEFVVGDQARCQQFGIKEGHHEYVKTRYYWRLVVETGEDYIVLSDKDKDELTTAEPAVGDNVVQLGYRGTAIPGRQSAIILSATTSDAPSQKYYQGINDYSMDHLVKDEGYDAEKGVFHCNTYGSSYTGDKDGGSFFKYDAEKKEATFKGKVNFQSGSTMPDGSAIEDIAKRTDLEKLGTASGNMLRNTSFEGDYESASFAEGEDIGEDTKVYSDGMKYWLTEGCEIADDSRSASGKAVRIKSGRIQQQMTTGMEEGKQYVLSFKSCGSEVGVEMNGHGYVVEGSELMARHELHVECTEADDIFAMSGDDCTVCEIMLTEGTLATAWAPALDDNDRSVAKMRDINYVTNAIEQGSTTIDGGLVMSQMIKVGNYRDKKMTQETGGVSGYYNDARSPFLWGGGSLEDAIFTIIRYAENPTYVPTEEVLRKMAQFVVTHGGRVIMNDAIVRGAVYAERGVFRGRVEATDGVFKGFVMKSETILTPDNIGEYTKTGTQAGYLIVDLEKTGSYIVVEGDMRTKFGSVQPVFWLPSCKDVDGKTGDHPDNALKYLGTTVIIANKSNMAIGVASDSMTVVGGRYTSTQEIARGWMVVAKNEMTYTYNETAKGTTYGIKWTGQNLRFGEQS